MLCPSGCARELSRSKINRRIEANHGRRARKGRCRSSLERSRHPLVLEIALNEKSRLIASATTAAWSRACFWFGTFADSDRCSTRSGRGRFLGRFFCGGPDQAPRLAFYCVAKFLDVLAGGSEIVDRHFQFF